MKNSQFYLAALLLSHQVLPVAAQSSAIDQAESIRRNWEQQRALMATDSKLRVPENYPGEEADLGPQRVLKVKQHRSLFEVVADSQYFYTDNAFLSGKPTTDTAIMVNTIQFALSPTPYDVAGGQFAPSLGFRSQWYNYDLDGHNDGLDRFDFNAQTAYLNARYRFAGNWIASAGFEYTRLLDQKRYKEFYSDYVPGVGLQRLFFLNDRTLLTVGVEEKYHFSWVQPLPRSDINDRLDSSLNFTLSYQVLPQLALQPFYRFSHVYYPRTAFNKSRNDLMNTIGLSVPYYFTDQFAVRVFLSAEFRESDDVFVADYTRFDAGLGASFMLRF